MAPTCPTSVCDPKTLTHRARRFPTRRRAPPTPRAPQWDESKSRHCAARPNTQRAVKRRRPTDLGVRSKDVGPQSLALPDSTPSSADLYTSMGQGPYLGVALLSPTPGMRSKDTDPQTLAQGQKTPAHRARRSPTQSQAPLTSLHVNGPRPISQHCTAGPNAWCSTNEHRGPATDTARLSAKPSSTSSYWDNHQLGPNLGA